MADPTRLARRGGETLSAGRRAHPGRTNEAGLLDDLPAKLGLRDRIRAHSAFGPVYRIAVAVVGVAVAAVGILLVPLPGPGWLVVFLGLGILATEFVWAERLLTFAKDRVRAWTRWLARQRRAVKALVATGTAAVVAGAVAAYLAWQGVPEWLPFD